jgi:hypothetical protein
MVWALIMMGTCALGCFTIYFKPGRKEHYMLLVALVHGLLVVLSIIELIYSIVFSDSFLAWKVRARLFFFCPASSFFCRLFMLLSASS